MRTVVVVTANQAGEVPLSSMLAVAFIKIRRTHPHYIRNGLHGPQRLL